MAFIYRASDGARTRDNQSHNLGLYLLSYTRRWNYKFTAFYRIIYLRMFGTTSGESGACGFRAILSV